MRQTETKCFYEFGAFRLDPQEKILTAGGEAVSLAPKVFDTLEAFVRNAGRLIEKNELMQIIWQDRFVEEGNLAFNVKELRRALSDSATAPRFIETVPRRGYRFIAEVREIFEDPKKILPAPQLNLTKRKSRLPAAVIIVFLLCAVAVASWLAQKRFSNAESDAPILSAPFRSEKITNTGKVVHAVISPDGKFVVYANETGGKFGVWLRHLETTENLQLLPPSDDLYFGFAFARDGQTIFFVRNKKNATTFADVYRVSIFGGVPEKIIERAEGWISVSPDDRQISFVRCNYQDTDFCSMFVADTDGKNERKILTRPRPIRLTDNQFSPDGRSIIFADGQSLNGSHEFRLRKFDFDSGAESVVSPKNFFDITSLKWLPDGNSLIAVAKETLDGRSKIWQVSVASGEARPLTSDTVNYAAVSLDKNADKIIGNQVANNFRLQISFGGATKDLTDAMYLTFTPDDKIVYSTADGDIWRINRDGSEQRQLTNDQSVDFEPRVSPNGQFVFFASNRSGANQIWRMNADGSSQTRLTDGEGGYPRFVSPDGRWVYYESGLHQTLWKVSTDGGEPIQVSAQKVYNPAFSPDGRFVAFFNLENRTAIYVMRLEDTKIVKTLTAAEEKSKVVKIAWANDNQTLEYVVSDGVKNSLWTQTLFKEDRRLVADLSDESVNDFALAPDDTGFAFIHGEWLHDAILIDGLK